MMPKVRFKKELQSIKEGIPYTWGSGQHYYVLLGGLTHSITAEGIQHTPHVPHNSRDLVGFRYATEIEIKD